MINTVERAAEITEYPNRVLAYVNQWGIFLEFFNFAAGLDFHTKKNKKKLFVKMEGKIQNLGRCPAFKCVTLYKQKADTVLTN